MAGSAADWVVVGIGNPEDEYGGTRHNLGADVVGLLADRHGAALKRQFKGARTGWVTIGGRRVLLARPSTYMNESGRDVAPLVTRHLDDPARLVVVHDELDLPVGVLKVKEGGGLAGHNGLRSIKAHLGTDAFTRVRIGVDKPAGRRQGADHVLRRPGKREREELEVVTQEAADAVELLVTEGPAVAMNRYNTRRPAEPA